MPPVKPEVCIIDGRLAVFMGADYKLLDPDAAEKFVRRVQGENAKLKRQEKRRMRDLKLTQGVKPCTSAN